MTTQQQLLEQAKQGEPRAIALLMARSLKAQGIAVKANLKGDCLRLMLESPQVPHQSTMVAFIRRSMSKLAPASIKTVKVYGKQVEATTPAWNQDIDLEGAIALLSPSTNPVLPIDSSIEKITSPTNKTPSSQPVYCFQKSFLSVCIFSLILLPYSVLIWFVVIAALMGIRSHALIAIALVNLVLTFVFFHYFKVYISPKGLKTYDFWGRYNSVDWSSITVVRRFNLLGLKYLLVSSTQSPKTLWVPSFVADRNRFNQLVSNYAGTEHTFTQSLFGKFHPNLTLEEIKGQIKAGWLAAVFLGAANFTLGLFFITEQYTKIGFIIDSIIAFFYSLQNKK